MIARWRYAGSRMGSSGRRFRVEIPNVIKASTEVKEYNAREFRKLFGVDPTKLRAGAILFVETD